MQSREPSLIRDADLEGQADDHLGGAPQLIAVPPPASAALSLDELKDLAFMALHRTRMPIVVSNPRLPDNPIVLVNQSFLDATGYPVEEVLGRNCRFLQGPDTDPAAVNELREAIAAERDVSVELLNYRKDGTPVWFQLLVSVVRDETGRVIYYFASQMDVTRRKQAQALERSELRLLREVDHRAKNALALVQGIVRLSSSSDAEVYARSVQGRVDALAQAHAALSETHWQAVQLERLLRAEIARFGATRVRLDGPPVGLPPAQVQPLSLLLHEMLSNAERHGALSAPEGSVELRWRETGGDQLVLEMHELGGPPPAIQRTPGFGTTMMQAIVGRQLGGRLDLDWQPDGLRSRITLPASPVERTYEPAA